ncbi:MAG: translocation/assembly module TamB domain-containing protein, partial [Pseudomonadota bacterium]
ALEIAGNAPIDELRVDLSFDVDQQRIMTGNLALDGTADGMRIGGNLGGPLSTILPEDYAKLLGTQSQLKFDAVRLSSGKTQITELTLDSGSISLAADAGLLADGFLSALNIDAQIAEPSGDKIVLPGSENPIQFSNAQIIVNYDAEKGSEFVQSLALEDVKASNLSIGDISLLTKGTVANFNNAVSRALEFSTSGALSTVTSDDAALAEAIGSDIEIAGAGSWKTGAPFVLSAFDIMGATYAMRSNGQFQAGEFDGQIGLEAADLKSFASISGRPLGGTLGLVATGKIYPFSGAFDLDFSGIGSRLQTGTQALDKLLTGSSNLSGGIKRDEDGITFNRFRVTNNQADILLDGRYSSELADLKTSVDLRDLADISESGSGAVRATATVNGQSLPYDAEVALTMPNGSLSGISVENLALSFAGKIGSDLLEGALTGDGKIGAQSISLDGDVRRDDRQLQVDGLAAQIGDASLKVDLIRDNFTELMTGVVAIAADDISAVAALALQKASGSLKANVTLSESDTKQAAAVNASARGLVFNEHRIGSADIKAQIDALLTKPEIDADIEASNLLLSGVAVKELNGLVSTNGEVTSFDVTSRLAQENTRIQTKGKFQQKSDEQLLAIETLAMQSNIGNANLIAPTKIKIKDGLTTIRNFQLNVAGGQIGINGSVSDVLALRATIDRLPLNIANAFNGSLGLGGSIDGSIDLEGPVGSPRAGFSISGSSVSARQLLEAQISPLGIQTRGVFDSASQTVSLERLDISNAQAIQISGTGRVPLRGAGLNVAADGTAPLEIAERFLASRGAKVSGQARFNITATGSIASPNLNGLLSVSGGALSDPLSNLRLTDIGLIAGLNGEQIAVQRFGAKLSGGGSINGSGTIGIAGDLPANLSIALNNAGYTDGQTFATTVNGNLELSGSLLRDPVLSGQINVGETEITVPESFASGSTLIEVAHVSPSTSTQQTLDRVTKVSPIPKPSARPSVLQLNLSIVAPNRIFVRGRGLDAELGGQLNLRGPTTNITPTGRFELRRGRLSLLGQRFDIDEGAVTLAGNLDPILYFVVQTDSGDVTSFITISGRTSDIQVSFSSDPELPEDEVLAQIIFGKSLSDLSPTQIARLASIAVELTGGNSPGLVDGLRSGLGLDDLDIVEDSDGNAAVKAGKYINDN